MSRILIAASALRSHKLKIFCKLLRLLHKLHLPRNTEGVSAMQPITPLISDESDTELAPT
ncbi:hypothetical protein H6G35_11870 [Aulosira sp. FACHB-113]|uniref:hypothetical protein n=1 Tax=Tolypothrix tenuis TaxID=457083 RepID=UPI0016880414|nr:hypothetical protein [Aulosira sp. FACHB-113]